MADEYSGRCALCSKLNLYDKLSFASDKYKCTRLNQYLPWSEKMCDKFERASGDREALVEKARRGRLS